MNETRKHHKKVLQKIHDKEKGETLSSATELNKGRNF